MSEFLKAPQIVSAALGLLQRESVLPGLVWRNGLANFRGALNDTISIRLPAFAPANSRVLRSGTTRQRDELYERKVDVTLGIDVYKDIKISDEALTLDITDFGTQVLNPVMMGIAQKVSGVLVGVMADAIYQNEIDYVYGGDPVKEIAIEARRLLNLANIPAQGRSLVLGGSLEAEFLGSQTFLNASASGTTATLREGSIGKVMGFDVFPANELDPDEGYAFHQTAYVLSNMAPVVPAGAPYGSSQDFMGFALRIVRVLDSTAIEDVLAVDSWVGCNLVTDVGFMDGDVFTPAEDPEDSGASELFVRAVKITAANS